MNKLDIKKYYFKLIDKLSFGLISELNNVISECHRDNSELIDIVDSLINDIEDIRDTLDKHRELSKNLQLQNDKLSSDNERLIVIIKALESKNVSYSKKHDDIDNWLMRHSIGKNPSDN